jgi:mannose-1-phosphate guanylyltransferase
VVHNSDNCYINSDEKLVAAIGVENLVMSQRWTRCSDASEHVSRM